MARRRGSLPVLGLAILLLAGTASAQQIASQVGNLLMTLTSAINTYHELRNMTAAIGAGRRFSSSSSSSKDILIAEPGPISTDPFSIRILKVVGSGGPTYEWKSATVANPPNVTITPLNSTNVTFTTKYTRSQTGFNPYTIKGVLELRNLQAQQVKIEGPVKVVLTLKRPSGVTTGPEVIETPVYAACGKESPIIVPAMRKTPGILKCNFEATLQQAENMMAAAEANMNPVLISNVDPTSGDTVNDFELVNATTGSVNETVNGTVTVAELAAAANVTAARAEALVPDVSVSAQAQPAVGTASVGPSGTSTAAVPPRTVSPPYKALFQAPDKACVAVNEVLTGPLAKYLAPSTSVLPAGLRTICGSGAEYRYEAQLGGWDASACGTNTLSNSPGTAIPGASAATVAIHIIGCNKTFMARPDITLTKLQAVKLVNHTWDTVAVVVPVVNKTVSNLDSGVLADNNTLLLPAGGLATAKFAVAMVKKPPVDMGPRLRGEISIKSGSMMPDVLSVARLAITSNSGAVKYLDLKCPPVVLGGAKCTFDAPWPQGGSGMVQAQLKTFRSRTFDVHSGTPKPFDFSNAETLQLGSCLAVTRSYVGKSAVNVSGMAVAPLVTFVTGVDSFLGAVNVNLTRYGLKDDSVGSLFGMGRRLLYEDATEEDYTQGSDGSDQAAQGSSSQDQQVDGGVAPDDQEADAAAAPAGAATAVSLVTDPVAAVGSGLLPFLHPQKILSGISPPSPSKAPLTVCDTKTLSWVEQFGGTGVDSCGQIFNALSTVTLTPNGTVAAGAQAPRLHNVSLPVLVAGCALKPAMKLLAVRTAAVKAYSWSVSAKSQDKGLEISQAAGKPATAKYLVAYNRTTALTNYTLEPALLLMNPFARALPLKSVFATVKVNGQPDIMSFLTCKGGSDVTGTVALPPAPSATTPVPIGCIGKIPLPGPLVGLVTFTALTTSGNVTTSPVGFDASDNSVDASEESRRCISIDGGFSTPDNAVSDAVVAMLPPFLTPFKVGASAPQAQQQLCEPKKFAFNATFGPLADQATDCGKFVARYVASIIGDTASSVATTPITVHGCSAPLPLVTLASLKPLNVTRKYQWSVNRVLTPEGVTNNLGLLSMDSDQGQLVDHTVTFKRSLAQQLSKEYHATGAVNVTNPSDKDTLTLSSVQLNLQRPGSPDQSLPISCPASAINPDSGDIAIEPLQSVRCTFDSAVSDLRPAATQVLVTLTDGSQATSGDNTPVLRFSKAANASLGDCALVWDDFGVISGPPSIAGDAAREAVSLRYVGEKPPSVKLGEAPLRICSSKEFKMKAQLGPFGAERCGSYSYGGTAVAQPLSGSQGVVSTVAGKLLDVLVDGNC